MLGNKHAAHPEPLECKLLGAVEKQHVNQVRNFLTALSTTSPQLHNRYELSLKPLTGKATAGAVSLKLQHDLPKELPHTEPGASAATSQTSWMAVCEGGLLKGRLANELCAAVRPVIHSTVTAADVPAAWQALGYVTDYEALKRGYAWNIQYQGRPMQVELHALFKVTNGQLQHAVPVHEEYWLLEVSTKVTDGQPAAACQVLGTFQQVLAPYVVLKKPTK